MTSEEILIQSIAAGQTDLKATVKDIYTSKGKAAALSFARMVNKKLGPAVGGQVNAYINVLDATDFTQFKGQQQPGSGAQFLPGEKSTPPKELPEIGKVKTPWGEISWGVTNNKALLTWGAIAVLAVIIVIYITRKK